MTIYSLSVGLLRLSFLSDSMASKTRFFIKFSTKITKETEDQQHAQRNEKATAAPLILIKFAINLGTRGKVTRDRI